MGWVRKRELKTMHESIRKPQRQHFLSIPVQSVIFLRYFAVPVVLLFFLGKDKDVIDFIIGGSILGVALLYAVITESFKWKNNTYLFTDKHIELVEGRFISKKRNVALGRIQSYQQKTSFFHKIVKQTSITMVTGSENIIFHMISEPELTRVIAILKATAAEKEAVEQVDTEAGVTEKVTQAVREHYLMSWKEIMLITFTSFYFLAIIPIGLTIYNQLEGLLDVDKYVKGAYDFISQSWIYVAALIILVLVISSGFGLLTTYLRLGKYRVRTDDTKIYISKGVLNTTNYTIPREKINGVIIQKSFSRRLFGIVKVKFVSLGEAFGELETETAVLFPFISMRRLRTLLPEILPEYPVEDVRTMERLPRKSLWHRLLIAVVIMLLFTSAGFYFFTEDVTRFWYVLLGIWIIAIGLTVLATRQSRYFSNAQFIQFQTGTLSASIFVTRRLKIDQLEMQQSWLQGKFGLANIGVTIREKPTHLASLPDLPEEVAAAYYDWYATGILEEKQER